MPIRSQYRSGKALLPFICGSLSLFLFQTAWLYDAAAQGNFSSRTLQEVIDRNTVVLKKNPSDADALVERGCAEVKLERFKAGLADINNGLRIYPQGGNVYVYDCRRQALCDQGQWKLAIEDATRSIKVEPKAGYRYKERAQLYQELQQNDLALKDFTTAIQVSPKEFWSRIDRGNFYVRLHKYDNAIADFTEAIKLAKTNPQPYESRAKIYEKLGLTDLARKDRESAQKCMAF